MKRFHTYYNMQQWVYTIPDEVWDKLSNHVKGILIDVGNEVDNFKKKETT